MMEPLLAHDHEGSSKGPAGRIGLYFGYFFFVLSSVQAGLLLTLFIPFLLYMIKIMLCIYQRLSVLDVHELLLFLLIAGCVGRE